MMLTGKTKNSLYPYQADAVSRLRSGSILTGGVGSGKSKTALAYYYTVECNGSFISENQLSGMATPKDLYIITTARKRDTLEWERECTSFLLSQNNRNISISGVLVVIDSWNNIKKYVDIKNAFFIFDEQRLVGSGVWVKTFLKIVKNNSWVLLTATPGDTWTDYIPAFVANGFYKNRTDFLRKHVVYNNFSRFPKIDHYVEISRLVHLKKKIVVHMDYQKTTTSHSQNILVEYNKEKYKQVVVDRWDPYKNKPFPNIISLFYLMRRVVNEDPSRLLEIKKLLTTHKKIIIFYNFNYELELLRTLKKEKGVQVSEYNGHIHQPLPTGNSWVYLVQYTSGAEGWNCIETDTIVFYSQNYSYKIMVQAAGRIDRLNTPFKDLYYYHLKSSAPIDIAIAKTLSKKQNFNELKFMKTTFERS